MSYTALYRKYRPLTFNEVVGQDHIVRTLKNQITSGRVGHAYLFNGSRGTGKTSSAKILSRAINCLNPKDGNPCNECEICKAALEGSLTDIVEMDAASNNSVEDIRSIRDEVNFLPTVAKYRVYIIDEVHMLSIGAFNALLKTLEEPPEHVKFILATTEPQKLPATILSRCQRFDFKKISNEYIKSRIEYICAQDKINIDSDAINTISVLADGAMRDALSILERCLQEDTEKITNSQVKELVGIPELESVYNVLNNVLNQDTTETLNSVTEILSEGKDISNLIWEIIKYTKDVLVFKATGKLDIYSADELQKIKLLSDKTDKNRLLNIIFELSSLANELKSTTQKNIMFQVGIMKLCSASDVKSAEKTVISTSEDTAKEVATQSLNSVQVVQSSGLSNEDLMTVNSRLSNLEGKLQKTVNAVKKIIDTPQIIHNSEKNVDNASAKNENRASKASSYNPNLSNIITNKTDGKNVDCWGKIVTDIKEGGKVMLYSNLANSTAIELNDMTVGIKLSEGLTPFGKSVIGKAENIAEITKLVSLEYGKPMQIRLIDSNSAESSENPIDSIAKELDLPLNIID